MKRTFTFIICLILICGTLYHIEPLSNLVIKLVTGTPRVIAKEKNQYYKNEDYYYVQTTDDFVPYNFQDILNIFYETINSGYKSFTFYCPAEYISCVNDVEYISSPEHVDFLSSISNFVSPFNNFSTINVLYDPSGEVTIEVNYLYNEKEIFEINQEIDRLWKELVTDDMTDEDIIYKFHDYIIDHTKYDSQYEDALKKGEQANSNSNKATGPLFDGYGICSGYTDLMAIILDRLNIKNFRISSNNHVWNLVYINKTWKHLDLTWDDPVSANKNINTLLHRFFLIDTEALMSLDTDNHNFNKAFYLELR